jgi:hypothetical protein
MTNAELINLAITLLTAIIAPVVALYVRSTVDNAVREQTERFNRFELSFTKIMGEHATHVAESEMRHGAHEKRFKFLEDQWQAYQERADRQQIFQREIVATQEGIAKILHEIARSVGEK